MRSLFRSGDTVQRGMVDLLMTPFSLVNWCGGGNGRCGDTTRGDRTSSDPGRSAGPSQPGRGRWSEAGADWANAAAQTAAAGVDVVQSALDSTARVARQAADGAAALRPSPPSTSRSGQGGGGRSHGEARMGGLYRITQTLQQELGDTAWAAYRLGDDAQRELLDFAFDVGGLSIDRVVARLSKWAAQVQETALVAGLRSGPVLLLEQARNNIEVYNLVKQVRERLGIVPGALLDLVRLVRKAYDLGPYADVWLIEGLGHDYTAQRLDRHGSTSPILREGPATAVPRGSLSMLHAGLGLALAERALAGLAPCSSPAAFRAALTTFVDACRTHGREGYRGAAYESLGLVTRTWHPQLVAPIDRILPEIDTALREYFWHGAGRALYFLPPYIAPGLLSPWRAADDEAPDDIARQNLYAGLAWATTLVNLRQPEIMAQWLRMRGERLWRSRAFLNGVASVIVVALDTTPGDPYVLAFAGYQPDVEDHIGDVWRAVIAPAVSKAVEWYQPVLSRHERLEVVFRACDLDEAVCRIERGELAGGSSGPAL